MASALHEETSKENIHQPLSLLRLERPFNNYGTSFKLGKCTSFSYPVHNQLTLCSASPSVPSSSLNPSDLLLYNISVTYFLLSVLLHSTPNMISSLLFHLNVLL